jgi:GTPase Era involved in 16S rRNA processing
VSSEPAGLAGHIRRIAEAARRLAGESDLGLQVETTLRRLDEPIRVAIAGRTKAGKSTLLNALVGERLAATDASECTRIVTWYRHALGYRVIAELRPEGIVAPGPDGAAAPRPDGTTVPRPDGTTELDFRRLDGALRIELGELSPERIERIEVGWPSSKLADLTLIDTPGLGSADEAVSARTTEALLDEDGERPGEADAVIYLMRHLHRYDAEFLEAFVDHRLAHASPINAVVVLSRADEIGAARPDALESARTVGSRYAADRRIRELASGVVPVAGLLAETGATLREQQVGWLRQVAALDEGRRERLLRSVDRFRDAELNPLAAEIREELLERLGLFGLRLTVRLLAEGVVRTATELSAALLDASGIRELQRVLDERFAARSEALRARSALAALRVVVDELARRGVEGARDLAAEVERVEAGSEQLALLRLLHLVLTGLVEVDPEERREVDRLTAPASAGSRVGLAGDATPEAIRAAALARIEHWRLRAANPMSDRRAIEAAEIVVRSYEQLYAGAG